MFETPDENRAEIELKEGDSNPFGLRFTDARPLVGRCRPSGTGCPPGAGIPPCPAATLILALVSALQAKPQEEQTNSAWLLREFLSIHPQALHRRDV